MTTAASPASTSPSTPASTSNKSSLNVALPKHVYDWFKQEAEASYRTLGAQVSMVLERHHKEATTPTQPPASNSVI